MAEKSIAFIGNYLPRKCGIATFTHDLCEAVALQAGSNRDVFAMAMNDKPEGYSYPDRVRFEIRQTNQADYRLAAEFLNVHQVSTVCLQHEYGIFGGTCGSHILGLLRRLRRPLVVTLHTVLHEPSEEQELALQEICRIADRIVVMTDVAHGILEDVFDVPPEKIATIPHGIPDTPFVDPHYFKDQFEVEGRKVLFTFGLLSPGKGIEYAIEALPAIVKKHPELIYILLGATHPHIKRDSGEEYRNSLLRRAGELGMSDNIRFVNRFVDLKELCEYLGAADLYLTPYLNEAQITSGTLAYAMGAGKATISTPYWYAKEMLADGRGEIVPFRDHEAISRQVIDLLDDEPKLHAMRKRAYTYCRQMTWDKVAQKYLDIYDEAKDAWLERKSLSVSVGGIDTKSVLDELPETDLRYLRTMTDDTGIFQHALFATPDRYHGYCVDDNARGLIAAAMHWDQTHDESILREMQTYLSFLSYAFVEETGRFRNFMGYDRRFLEKVGSEDSHARSLWALGVGVALCPHELMIKLASQLFHAGLGVTEKFTSPRAWAFTIVGIQAYLRRFGGDSEVRRIRSTLAEKLLSGFTNYSGPNWPWCENIVSYASAKIPHALLMCGKWMQRNDMIDVGKRALEWLVKIQTNEAGTFSFIGTNGWLVRDGNHAHFDQQPIEAHATVEACVEAYRITREDHWLDYARKAFNWFLGDNDLRTPLYDFTTGGCRDGLHHDRVNENQGAESVLAWMMSLLLLQDLEMERTLSELQADKVTKQRPVAKAIKPSGPVVGTKKQY